MDSNKVEDAFVLGHSLIMLDKKSGILRSGRDACNRLLKYALNPDADHETVRNFILSIYYDKRSEFDCNALLGLDAQQRDDCLLAYQLNCHHKQRFQETVLANLGSWKWLDVGHFAHQLRSR